MYEFFDAAVPEMQIWLTAIAQYKRILGTVDYLLLYSLLVC